MEEIEVSSRLYHEDGGYFMTALLLGNSDTDHPVADVVTFVLAREKLITIRYFDPQPFKTYAARCERTHVPAQRGDEVLLGVLDVIIDRLADVLERAGTEVETISREIFDSQATERSGAKDFQGILRRLGRKHDLTGKMRESLLTIGRMLSFLSPAMEGKPNKDVRSHTKTLTRDVQSLQDHVSYLVSKLGYLQDGTLGLINNEQNNIIKIMSVAAMVFLPPTLLASIWGMNFRYMPDLGWTIWGMNFRYMPDLGWILGYPFALLLMAVSAVLPYLWFKRRGWL
jgi:magnesium transporter